jgi:hypothetical protein
MSLPTFRLVIFAVPESMTKRRCLIGCELRPIVLEPTFGPIGAAPWSVYDNHIHPGPILNDRLGDVKLLSQCTMGLWRPWMSYH